MNGRTNPSLSVRVLAPDDLEAFRALRLECLRLHPEAFGSSFEEEEAAEPAFWRERLQGGEWTVFGGFVDDALSGLAGLIRDTKRKHAHLATFGAMYVRAAARGTGLGDALVAGALDAARANGIATVFLTVTVGNDVARRLYERHGFVVYGQLDDTLRTGGRSYGEVLMRRVLSPSPFPAGA